MDSARELSPREWVLEKARQSVDAITGQLAVHQAYRDVFTSPQGQIVLRHLMRKFHVASSTFVAGDPTDTARQEGERRVILSILRAVYRNEDELIRELQRTYG